MTTTAPRAQRSATLTFTQTILALQSFAAVFGSVAIYGLDRAGQIEVSPAVTWGGGLGLAVALMLATGVQKRPWGRWVGSILQLPMLAATAISPALGVVGTMFVVLWITALRLGGRIDKERAERLTRHTTGDDAQGDTG